MRWHGYIGRLSADPCRPSNPMSLLRGARANCSRALSTCPMRSPTCAARTVRRTPMHALAGIDRCSTSRTPSRSARSRTKWRALAGRDPLDYLRELIKAQRVDYLIAMASHGRRGASALAAHREGPDLQLEAGPRLPLIVLRSDEAASLSTLVTTRSTRPPSTTLADFKRYRIPKSVFL